jgi:hypothetical protein
LWKSKVNCKVLERFKKVPNLQPYDFCPNLHALFLEDLL